MGTIVSSLTGKSYPDGWFSVGVKPREKKGDEEKQYDRDYEQQYNSYTEKEIHYGRHNYVTYKFFDGYDNSSYRFISRPKSSQLKRKYGTHGITTQGKRAVKGASALLQKCYSRRRLGFCTLTIPNYHPSHIKYFAANWSKIVRVFYQKLKRHFDNIGAPFLYVSVTEIQQKRYKETGAIAPHLHFCYIARASKRNSGYYISANELRQMWSSVIMYYAEKSGIVVPHWVTFKASVDCQIVKKSVSSYLGKYMSKGGEVIEDINDEGRENELPSQWWTMNASMREMYKKSIKSIDNAYMSMLFYDPNTALELGIIRWYQDVYVCIDGKDRRVGVCGYFTNAYMQKAAEEGAGCLEINS